MIDKKESGGEFEKAVDKILTFQVPPRKTTKKKGAPKRGDQEKGSRARVV